MRTQGFLTLEVFGQLRPVLPDASAAYEETLAAALAPFGVVSGMGG